MTGAVRVGDVIEVAEPDYRYGTGRLVLRVTVVGQVLVLPDGEWLELEGLALRPDGSPLVERPRPALVRVAALLCRRSGGRR
jgi:hypothetical protein